MLNVPGGKFRYSIRFLTSSFGDSSAILEDDSYMVATPGRIALRLDKP